MTQQGRSRTGVASRRVIFDFVPASETDLSFTPLFFCERTLKILQFALSGELRRCLTLISVTANSHSHRSAVPPSLPAPCVGPLARVEGSDVVVWLRCHAGNLTGTTSLHPPRNPHAMIASALSLAGKHVGRQPGAWAAAWRAIRQAARAFVLLAPYF